MVWLPVNPTESEGWLSVLGFLALPVGLTFFDEFVGCRLQSVHRRLGQQRVSHHGQDLRGFAVTGDDGRCAPVAFAPRLRPDPRTLPYC